jgi:hypothetical protein
VDEPDVPGEEDDCRPVVGGGWLHGDRGDAAAAAFPVHGVLADVCCAFRRHIQLPRQEWQTAVHHAVVKAMSEIWSVLVSAKGIKSHVKDGDGSTSSYPLAQNEDLGIVRNTLLFRRITQHSALLFFFRRITHIRNPSSSSHESRNCSKLLFL